MPVRVGGPVPASYGVTEDGHLRPLREVAYLTLRLHDDSSVNIEGNIADLRLALDLLDSARAVISAKVGKPTILEPHGAGLYVPPEDAPVRTREDLWPLVAVGDRPADRR